MSSTNKTALGLNMWEASDKPVRQDFVNDNIIIDERISKLNSDLTTVNNKTTELNSNLATLISELGTVKSKLLTALGAFVGTITRNSSSITGKQVNVSVSITAPATGIANETTFFYINKKLRPVVASILLSTYETGYIYSFVNEIGDTVFAARVEGGIPAYAEIYINFTCFIDD